MNLGAIRASQGDTKSAVTLLDQAVDCLRLPTNRSSAWHVYMERGRVHLMAGDFEKALADLRKSVELAQIWRVDAIANDANRMGTEAELAELYDLFINAGNRLYEAGGNSALILETFNAAEENRAASLRALVPQAVDWRNRLSGQYWELLAKLPKEETEWLQAGERPSPSLRAIQSQLQEMEAAAGSPPPKEESLALTHARASLSEDSVLLSFHLGETQSWIWAVTKDAIALRRLPARAILANEIRAFSDGVAKNLPLLDEQGAGLYRSLFGTIPPPLLNHPRWILALDQELFDLPFSALPAGDGQPLIVNHSIQIASGALMLQQHRARPNTPGSFLGVGDPVYNGADARASSSQAELWVSSLQIASLDSHPSFARLWGTAEEIRNSAIAWGASATTLLTGADASKERVWTAIGEKPEVIHLATHILEKNERMSTGWIALSRGPDGQVEYLTPAEISVRAISARLVVLSGCSSGKAEIRTATGLMGLTRSWIAAGAGAVLATRWPEVDDNGAFFVSFYRNFRDNPSEGADYALQQASIEMLHSGTWRAKPSFWASYFLVGNN